MFRIKEMILVEGRYDMARLANLVDAFLLPTNGFSIFKDEEKKELIRSVGAKRGIIILTDSDAAGFQIRHYIEKIAAGLCVKNAYIPDVPGKESRKARFSKEGTLGVEGMEDEVLLEALRRCGALADGDPAPGADRRAGRGRGHHDRRGESWGARLVQAQGRRLHRGRMA